MPLPIEYIGTQDDDRTRSIDVVHIEPSIREGTFLLSSLYGRDASLPLYRFPPVNTNPPYVSGPQEIPGTMQANYGRWVGSPSPVFAVQWQRDGVDIPGATSPTYVTTAADDGTFISFELRGFNIKGESYAFSDTKGVSLIEPVFISEQEDYAVLGLQASLALTNLSERDTILTGMSALNRFDVNAGTAYFLTGHAADLRLDCNAKSVAVIQGLPQEGRLTMRDGPAVSVITRWCSIRYQCQSLFRVR